MTIPNLTIEQFLDFLDRNKKLSAESRRFINNILSYIQKQNLSNEESAKLANEIINGTVGISLHELSSIRFHDEPFNKTDNKELRKELTAYVSETGDYIIPVEWSVYSTVIVKHAANLQEAVDKVNAAIDMIPLCADPEYVDGSYKISADIAEDYINAQEYRTIGDVELTENIIIWKDGKIVSKLNPDGSPVD